MILSEAEKKDASVRSRETNDSVRCREKRMIPSEAEKKG